MTANGNDPRLSQLETTLRGMQAVQPAAPEPVEAEATYDLATRTRETSQAMRELARYSNEVADALDRNIASYIANMGRLLGKLGK